MNNFPFEVEKLWSSVSNRAEKETIAKEMISFAKDGQVIGFGSGTTSMVCALAFGDAVKDGLDIKAVVTSYELAWLCESLNIDVLELSDDVQIDWCFDGADEVHDGKNLLKGRGGAMHRERKVFNASKKRFVVADSTKDVSVLGEKFPAPIEVIPNKLIDVYKDLNLLGFDSVSIRLAGAGSKDGPVITESGNAIVDIINRSGFSPDCVNDITNLNGVFDTGLFMNYEFERIS
ncbi:MAG: ribose 5-phosphate isomerase A [Acidimicrobiia bacterium]|nr:ribose 5-phosphate isomerase A [Acidimicrobiia bacterium]